MENHKRHLELAVVKVDGDQVTFRIAEQTHREKNFTPNGNEFKSSSGYSISSCSCPEYDGQMSILYVRGCNNYEDDIPVTVPLSNFAKIMEAVTEYNETDGKGYEKPWPQNNDRYYCISEGGLIYHTNFHDDYAFDNNRLSFGNCFRTREEAESALERVKKALKGIDENKLLREALEEAVAMYGKPGGPWNVPGDAGGWISKARKALEVGK